MNRVRAEGERPLEPGPEVEDAGLDVVVEQVGRLVAPDALLQERILARVEGLATERSAEGNAFEDGRVVNLPWRCRGLSRSKEVSSVSRLQQAPARPLLHQIQRTHLGVPDNPLHDKDGADEEDDAGDEALLVREDDLRVGGSAVPPSDLSSSTHRGHDARTRAPAVGEREGRSGVDNERAWPAEGRGERPKLTAHGANWG